MLGELDVLDELHMRVEMKGRSEDTIKLARLGELAGSAEIENLDTLGLPGVGHSRDPTIDAQRHAFHD